MVELWLHLIVRGCIYSRGKSNTGTVAETTIVAMWPTGALVSTFNSARPWQSPSELLCPSRCLEVPQGTETQPPHLKLKVSLGDWWWGRPLPAEA